MINESNRYMISEEVSDDLYNKAINDFKNEKFTTKSGTEWEVDYDNRAGYFSYLSNLTQDKFEVVGTPYWEGDPILPFVVTDLESGDIVYDEKIVLPGAIEEYNKEDLKEQIQKQLEIIEGLIGGNSSESNDSEYKSWDDVELTEDELDFIIYTFNNISDGPLADNDSYKYIVIPTYLEDLSNMMEKLNSEGQEIAQSIMGKFSA